MVMDLDEFVGSLHRRDFNICGMFADATVEVAKKCVVRHSDKDGLICHYFSGSPSEYMTAGGRHSFMVVPGSWAKAIIGGFESKCLRGPSLATQEEKDGENFSTDFNEGVYGVVFEMSFIDAMSELEKISAHNPKLRCRYTMVRFILQEYTC